LIRVLTAGLDRVQSLLCRLPNKNTALFGADTIHDYDSVMGDKPVWLEGKQQKTFFFVQITRPSCL